MSTWGLAAVPALAAMSWGLLGIEVIKPLVELYGGCMVALKVSSSLLSDHIEAAAVECERPFGRRAGHLALGRF